MIRAVIKFPGIFVDKPHTDVIELDETQVALEHKNENTGKFEKLTIDQLFTAYLKRHYLVRGADESENIIDHTFFEFWFFEKHLKNKPYHNRILDMQFERIYK